MTPGFVAQAREILRKDLMVEGRSGEVLLVTVPFGAMALLLIPLAIGTDTQRLSEIGPGMFWVVVILFGMLVTIRSTSIDPPACGDLLTMLGVDPVATYAGRAVGTTVLLVVFQAIIAPVMIVLYAPAGVDAWVMLPVIAILVAIGLAQIGTMAATITAGVRTANVLAPLLIAPLSFPMILAAAEATDLLADGASIIRWILLLVAMDIGLAIVGVVIAGSREPEAGARPRRGRDEQ